MVTEYSSPSSSTIYGSVSTKLSPTKISITGNILINRGGPVFTVYGPVVLGVVAFITLIKSKYDVLEG